MRKITETGLTWRDERKREIGSETALLMFSCTDEPVLTKELALTFLEADLISLS